MEEQGNYHQYIALLPEDVVVTELFISYTK